MLGIMTIALLYLLVTNWIKPYPVGKKKLRKIIREELTRERSEQKGETK